MVNDELQWKSGKCLESLCRIVEPSEFGYRIQGFAAHILLRIGAQVIEINNQGHPDIVAKDDLGTIRIEVEAAISGLRPHQPQEDDLVAIAPKEEGDRGYFGLALFGPYPRWLLIEYSRLKRRKAPASPEILAALADGEISDRWTKTFINLVIDHCDKLQSYSFDYLKQRALQDRRL